MADKAIAIIGGGLAGLAAGVYAQRNGYRYAHLRARQPAGGRGRVVAAGRLPHRRRHPFPDGAQAGRGAA